MEPIPADAERSVRRSRVRLRVLLVVSALGEAYPSQIARAVGVKPSRVREAMFGNPPDFRASLGLVPLGLVRASRSPNGMVYEITTRGRRKARSFSSRLRDRRW